MVLHRQIRGRTLRETVSVAMAQPPQPQHPQDRVDAPWGMDPLFGAHRPRQQMGINDQDASRKDRQLDKKSLELNHEEKERGIDGHSHR